ncbi:MAG: hypothetical protein EBZ77_01360 [Chitinophagia bacterium]|nr:hypothetical protein [Chitinophagia bacterium]
MGSSFLFLFLLFKGQVRFFSRGAPLFWITTTGGGPDAEERERAMGSRKKNRQRVHKRKLTTRREKRHYRRKTTRAKMLAAVNNIKRLTQYPKSSHESLRKPTKPALTASWSRGIHAPDLEQRGSASEEQPTTPAIPTKNLPKGPSDTAGDPKRIDTKVTGSSLYVIGDSKQDYEGSYLFAKTYFLDGGNTEYKYRSVESLVQFIDSIGTGSHGRTYTNVVLVDPYSTLVTLSSEHFHECVVRRNVRVFSVVKRYDRADGAAVSNSALYGENTPNALGKYGHVIGTSDRLSLHQHIPYREQANNKELAVVGVRLFQFSAREQSEQSKAYGLFDMAGLARKNKPELEKASFKLHHHDIEGSRLSEAGYTQGLVRQIEAAARDSKGLLLLFDTNGLSDTNADTKPVNDLANAAAEIVRELASHRRQLELGITMAIHLRSGSNNKTLLRALAPYMKDNADGTLTLVKAAAGAPDSPRGPRKTPESEPAVDYVVVTSHKDSRYVTSYTQSVGYDPIHIVEPPKWNPNDKYKKATRVVVIGPLGNDEVVLLYNKVKSMHVVWGSLNVSELKYHYTTGVGDMHLITPHGLFTDDAELGVHAGFTVGGRGIMEVTLAPRTGHKYTAFFLDPYVDGGSSEYETHVRRQMALKTAVAQVDSKYPGTKRWLDTREYEEGALRDVNGDATLLIELTLSTKFEAKHRASVSDAVDKWIQVSSKTGGTMTIILVNQADQTLVNIRKGSNPVPVNTMIDARTLNLGVDLKTALIESEEAAARSILDTREKLQTRSRAPGAAKVDGYLAQFERLLDDVDVTSNKLVANQRVADQRENKSAWSFSRRGKGVPVDVEVDKNTEALDNFLTDINVRSDATAERGAVVKKSVYLVHDSAKEISQIDGKNGELAGDIAKTHGVGGFSVVHLKRYADAASLDDPSVIVVVALESRVEEMANKGNLVPICRAIYALGTSSASLDERLQKAGYLKDASNIRIQNEGRETKYTKWIFGGTVGVAWYCRYGMGCGNQNITKLTDFTCGLLEQHVNETRVSKTSGVTIIKKETKAAHLDIRALGYVMVYWDGLLYQNTIADGLRNLAGTGARCIIITAPKDYMKDKLGDISAALSMYDVSGIVAFEKATNEALMQAGFSKAYQESVCVIARPKRATTFGAIGAMRKFV